MNDVVEKVAVEQLSLLVPRFSFDNLPLSDEVKVSIFFTGKVTGESINALIGHLKAIKRLSFGPPKKSKGK